MNRTLLSLAALSVLAGCSTTTGLTAAAIGGTVASVFSPSTVSPDYGAYLKHCTDEVQAQRDAAKADSEALQTALSSSNEKTQFGAMILLAVKSGNQGPRIGCTVARKKDMSELLLGESNLLNLGVELYRENRANVRFKKQLEADKELSIVRMEHEENMADRNADLLTTLTGDKLTLQESRQDNEFRTQQLNTTAGE